MARTKAEPEEELVTPPVWQDLVGVAALLQTWRDLVAGERLPATLLLVGRAGIGKRALLAALTAMHYCESGTACGSCGGCGWLLSGAHPEVLWLDPGEGAFLSEHATKLQEHLALSPGPGAKHRIVVMANADRLTEAAANRLLKTLEEPPPHARLFLSTSRVNAMLPTVLSRLVRWQIAPPPVAESMAWLRTKLASSGQPEMPEADLMETLRRSGLAPGLAWRELSAGEADGGLDLSILTTAKEAAQVIDWAEQLTRREGWPAAAILTQWELALNQQYRQILLHAPGETGAKAGGVMARTRQRQLLRTARELVRGARVPLNAQLLCEALALAQRL